MTLTMSATGLTALAKDEGVVDGLYDDASGYCTFGVGHLVHKTDKWSCLTLAAGRSKEAWKGKLQRTLGVTYLGRSAVQWADWNEVRKKAVELGAAMIATKKNKVEADKLTETQRSAAKGSAEAAVAVEVALLARTTASVLSADLRRFEVAVNKAITGVTLTQAEFDALVSLAFNIGVTGFKSSTVVKKINENKYRSGNDVRNREIAITDIANAFGMWNKSAGVVLSGLTARRKSESDRFLKKAREELLLLRTTNPALARRR